MVGFAEFFGAALVPGVLETPRAVPKPIVVPFFVLGAVAVHVPLFVHSTVVFPFLLVQEAPPPSGAELKLPPALEQAPAS